MVDRRLVNNIKEDLKRGFSIAELKSKYIARYSDVDIDEAIWAAKGIEISKSAKKTIFYESEDQHGRFFILLFIGVFLAFSIVGAAYFLVLNEGCADGQYKEQGICINYACTGDEDCNDNNLQTEDICLNSSTKEAKCAYRSLSSDRGNDSLQTCGSCSYFEDGVCRQYVCCSDSDCNDDNEDTVDKCSNLGTKDAVCEYEGVGGNECECGYVTSEGCFPYVCCSDSDCNDDNIDTQDSCLEPSSEYSACLNEYPFEEEDYYDYGNNFTD